MCGTFMSKCHQEEQKNWYWKVEEGLLPLLDCMCIARGGHQELRLEAVLGMGPGTALGDNAGESR